MAVVGARNVACIGATANESERDKLVEANDAVRYNLLVG